jgi:intein/homing endonuclease
MTAFENNLAELAGAFAGDGWISRGNSGSTLFISGNPKDERNYYDNRIVPLLNETFKVKIRAREFRYWGTYGILTCNKNVLESFLKLGFTTGKKAFCVKVPDCIKENNALHKHFIRGLFDTDGCIYFQRSYGDSSSMWQKKYRHRPVVSISTISLCLYEELCSMLNSLGFKFYKKKPHKGKTNKNLVYTLKVESKENVKKWFSEIKPANEKHLNRFNKWLEKGYF